MHVAAAEKVASNKAAERLKAEVTKSAALRRSSVVDVTRPRELIHGPEHLRPRFAKSPAAAKRVDVDHQTVASTTQSMRRENESPSPSLKARATSAAIRLRARSLEAAERRRSAYQINLALVATWEREEDLPGGRCTHSIGTGVLMGSSCARTGSSRA